MINYFNLINTPSVLLMLIMARIFVNNYLLLENVFSRVQTTTEVY